MIAALACWSKIGLDREVALAPSVPTPTVASLRPWDTRIAIKCPLREGFSDAGLARAVDSV